MFINKPLHQFILNNGLKIILKEDHRAPVVIFQIFYMVGSSFEVEGITGISHVLEHMMFKGTKNNSSDYFLKTVAGYGGQQNAYTTHDYTSYYEIMPANKLSYCFKFEADRLSNLLLRAKDFHKEIKVVAEERRMMIEDDPERLALEHFNAFAYTTSPYRHPIIGWMSDIDRLTVNDIRHWYKKWYATNNAVIVIVGDTTPNQVKTLAKQFFGHFKPSLIPEHSPPNRISQYVKRHAVIKTQSKLERIIIAYDVPVINTALEEWEPFALLYLCNILAGSKSSRLQQTLIQKKEIALEVDFHYSPFHRLDTLLMLTAVPAKGHYINQLKDNIFLAIRLLQQKRISPSELNRTKTEIIANRIYDSDSIEQQAHEIGSLAAVGMSTRAIDQIYKKLNSITTAQIQMVARKYLTKDREIFVNFEPQTDVRVSHKDRQFKLGKADKMHFKDFVTETFF